MGVHLITPCILTIKIVITERLLAAGSYAVGSNTLYRSLGKTSLMIAKTEED